MAPRFGLIARMVFAHYMVGLTSEQDASQWRSDIIKALSAGIDGFALNVGPDDHWTIPQLQLAYHQAAEHIGQGRFALFLSFDMAAGEWEVDHVAGLIKQFSDSPAQLRVQGRVFVSTFEGPAWADNWAAVREKVDGGLFLVPDWSSLGPWGVREKLGLVDGAFSWSAWPQPGQHRMHAGEDRAYKEALGGKAYMMGVSPHFYTNLPRWNKNWYSSSESLWFDRWQQVQHIMPDFVQIITWNDYGESSYICDTAPHQIVDGAQHYTTEYPHSAFRAVLPYLIAAYKAGSYDIPLPSGARSPTTAIAWYRTSPARATHDGGTVWGQGGCVSAADGARDVISVMTVTAGRERVEVAIGGVEGVSVFETPGRTGVAYFEVPFEGRTGLVSLRMQGREAVGPAIMYECLERGHVNFNVVAIEV